MAFLTFTDWQIHEGLIVLALQLTSCLALTAVILLSTMDADPDESYSLGRSLLLLPLCRCINRIFYLNSQHLIDIQALLHVFCSVFSKGVTERVILIKTDLFFKEHYLFKILFYFVNCLDFEFDN